MKTKTFAVAHELSPSDRPIEALSLSVVIEPSKISLPYIQSLLEPEVENAIIINSAGAEIIESDATSTLDYWKVGSKKF